MKLFFAVLTIALYFFPFSALAHTTQTDGQVSVLMHINPDDDPIIGSPAELLFDVTDSSNRFTVTGCNCRVSLTANGASLFSGPVSPVSGGPSIFSFSLPFVFSQKAVYTIVMSGSPKTAGAFQNFSVSYDQRVTRTNGLPTLTTLNHLGHDHFEHLVIFGGGFAVAIYFIIKDRRQKSLKQKIL